MKISIKVVNVENRFGVINVNFATEKYHIRINRCDLKNKKIFQKKKG